MPQHRECVKTTFVNRWGKTVSRSFTGLGPVSWPFATGRKRFLPDTFQMMCLPFTVFAEQIHNILWKESAAIDIFTYTFSWSRRPVIPVWNVNVSSDSTFHRFPKWYLFHKLFYETILLPLFQCILVGCQTSLVLKSICGPCHSHSFMDHYIKQYQWKATLSPNQSLVTETLFKQPFPNILWNDLHTCGWELDNFTCTWLISGILSTPHQELVMGILHVIVSQIILSH